jgi:hypothetical protein
MTLGEEIRRFGFSVLLSTSVIVGGCHRHLASAADCSGLLDRLVELELKESGYRDPALGPRWQQELARRFETDLRQCRTLRVRDDFPNCLRGAQNPEEITHRCLK